MKFVLFIARSRTEIRARDGIRNLVLLLASDLVRSIAAVLVTVALMLSVDAFAGFAHEFPVAAAVQVRAVGFVLKNQQIKKSR